MEFSGIANPENGNSGSKNARDRMDTRILSART
jgi:hypothetical protein